MTGLGETGATLTAHLERATVGGPGPLVYLGRLSVGGPGTPRLKDDIHPLEYDPLAEGSLGLAERDEFFRFLSDADVSRSQQGSAWSAFIRQSVGYALALQQWSSPVFLDEQRGRMQDMRVRTRSGQRKDSIAGFIQQIDELIAGEAVGVPACYGSPVAQPFMVELIGETTKTTPVTVFDNASRERARLDFDSLLGFFKTLHGPDRAMSLPRQKMAVAFLDGRIASARKAA